MINPYMLLVCIIAGSVLSRIYTQYKIKHELDTMNLLKKYGEEPLTKDES